MIRPLHIHYLRPPDHATTYVQDLIVDAPDVKISLQRAAPLERPLEVAGHPVLEPGSPIVWFTFPGKWHDIGRCHLQDGTFTGYYANILTPVELHESQADEAHWHTTDLFLDVWLGADDELHLLDEEEWAAATTRGHLDAGTARRARREAAGLMEAARRGDWPPPIVADWTLDRILSQRED